ncbi:MAG TPA: hypothetical protein VGI39_28585, partial [Polyangiaceae bacterium]
MRRPAPSGVGELTALAGGAALLALSLAGNHAPGDPSKASGSGSSDGVGVWNEVAHGPLLRSGQAMAYGGGGVTLLFGGLASGALQADTWGWDGARWTALADLGPSAREGAGLAFDAARSRTVLFGGSAAAGLNAETWEWSGTAWSNVTPVVDGAAAGPSARAGVALAYDSLRK